MSDDGEKKPKPKPMRRAMGVQQGTIERVAASVFAAESAEANDYEMRQIQLDHIELWDEQPRTFHLTMEDIYQGELNPRDPLYSEKSVELEDIVSLAMSIKEFGMLNSPLAFSLPGKRVQLLGGQRRTMAAIYGLLHIQTRLNVDGEKRYEVNVSPTSDLGLLEEERIQVKVFTRKPDQATVERVGMVDNVMRSDLPISDKLKWVIHYADEHIKGRDIEWQELVETLGLSRSQSYEWVRMVNSRQCEWVAKVIARVLDEKAALKNLMEISALKKEEREGYYNQLFGVQASQAPAPSQKVTLGSTSNLSALRRLILKNVTPDAQALFANVDWSKPRHVKKAFNDFLVYWEENNGYE